MPLPKKAEQEAIAEALSDADAFIESLEQLIAKKRQIKQGAMQELLTNKRRLPGLSPPPPRSGEWEVKHGLGGIWRNCFEKWLRIQKQHRFLHSALGNSVSVTIKQMFKTAVWILLSATHKIRLFCRSRYSVFHLQITTLVISLISMTR